MLCCRYYHRNDSVVDTAMADKLALRPFEAFFSFFGKHHFSYRIDLLINFWKPRLVLGQLLYSPRLCKHCVVEL
jgi:hypothetical protein